MKIQTAALLGAFLSMSALAQTPDSDLPEWLGQRIQPVHYGLNEFVDNTSRGIDRFFGTDESLFVDNKSYLRLGQEYQRFDSRNFTDTKLRFRLDLPTTREKLRVIIESDVDEVDSNGSNGASQLRTNDSRQNTDSILGLEQRRNIDERERWNPRLGVGVRLRSGLDPYVRFTTTRQYSLSEDSPWSLRSFNRLTYYDKKGYVAKVNLDLNRPLATDRSLRFLTQMEWEQDRRDIYFANSIEYNQILNQRSAMRYAVIMLGDTARNPEFYDRVLQVYYRRDIHKKFIYADIIPEYHNPRDNRDPFFSLTLRLEMFFRGDFTAPDPG